MADPTTDLDALVARMRELHAPDPEEPGSCFMEYPCEMPALLDALDALRTRLAATITERLDAVTRAELAETACLSARAERDAAQARVRRAADMLAVIHRDGGHYLEGHGWDKACADAEARVWALVEALEGLRYRPAPGEPARFCDHAAEPCPRCERARAALDALAAPERGDG